MQRAIKRILGLLGIGMLFAAGCDGRTVTLPNRNLVPAMQPRRGAMVESAPSIGGIVNTKTFVVKSGTTVKVSKNVAIFASGSVTIAGTLIVPRGISVAFFTPSFTLAGRIATAVNKKWSGEVDDLLSACHVRIELAGSWTLGAGDNLGITSSVKPRSNPKNSCTVSIDNPSASGIVLTPGTNGGTDKKRPNGENGGWIEIGSPQAIRATRALAKKDNHAKLAAYPPDQVTISGSLAAGGGGAGKSDNSGKMIGGTYTFKATNGGIGGSVHVVAGTLSAAGIQAGSGGSGGQLMLDFSPSSIDGTLSSPDGKPLSVTMGAGGGGGAVQIAAKLAGSPIACAGNGGSPSPIRSYYLGNNVGIVAGDGFGGPPYPTTSGTSTGGDATLVLGAPGKKGPGSDGACTSPPKDGAYTPIWFAGGRGSAWLSMYAMPGASVPGGTGGTLTIVPPKHVTMSSLAKYGLSFFVDAFGTGGNSLIACNQVPGIPGGNGGTFHDNGLVRFVSNRSGSYAGGFNGGAGSDGSPPGAGGKGGEDDEGQHVGKNGPSGGSTC